MHERDRETDGRTDGRTETPGHSKDRVYAQRRAVKIFQREQSTLQNI